MKTNSNTKKLDLQNIKTLSRAEQAKVLGGNAEAESEHLVGIAIAAAGAAKALGYKVK
jgi:hypothetical protein